MANYAIGDVHGCLEELELLLKKIKFNQSEDTLWFVGDTINRGKYSLETIAFIMSIENNVKYVLGNHEIYLLSLAIKRDKFYEGKLSSILKSSRCEEICQWLGKQSLLHYDQAINCMMVHAGFPPNWDIKKAIKASQLFDQSMNNNWRNIEKYINIHHKYNYWLDELEGDARTSAIINCLTKIRMVTQDGILNTEYTGNQAYAEFKPWFELNQEIPKQTKLIFGHWASLNKINIKPNVYCIDTGCCWGAHLTALNLQDNTIYQVRSKV